MIEIRLDNRYKQLSCSTHSWVPTMTQESTTNLLEEIRDYCRHAGIAESTFGRQAINDGKLCARLRNGKSVTLKTAERVHAYIDNHQPDDAAEVSHTQTRVGQTTATNGDGHTQTDRPFRFYDNRQKYLAFVNTCNEKWKISERAAKDITYCKIT